ncbi:hypothetical protein BG261_05490 [Floricoccus tropicus]|uniref:YopX protein domain-containing protein n=1 Tax=Floricoccus tropicus TaxID=1859473 RepID=A0A1E8GMI0_9LACT|nr:YopX family protein [Floricoccus tropicus]OFI48843.1 hypothetical protein BG261_05490 [Floricoccus tropicus]
MREIKFRAYSKEKCEMFKSEDVVSIDFTDKMIELYRSDDGLYENPDSRWETLYLDELELMQYTGLKDKDGAEIYEGDIVSYNFFEFSFIGVVKNDCYCFYIEDVFDDTHDFDDFVDTTNGTPKCDDLIVIGNIYENPELLEQE